jgi:hypothetical protein
LTSAPGRPGLAGTRPGGARRAWSTSAFGGLRCLGGRDPGVNERCPATRLSALAWAKAGSTPRGRHSRLKSVKADIESRFNAASGQGRRAVAEADVLRAAVVFLHATLEDLLRSLLEWKLPQASAHHLKDIPLEGKKPRTSFTLDELAAYRGTTVDDLIKRSVSASLEESNFNHPGEVDRVLDRIGLPRATLDPYRGKLGPMMQRRHWIVHRADRNTASGRGHHSARPLQQTTVETWRRALEQFGGDVLKSL